MSWYIVVSQTGDTAGCASSAGGDTGGVQAYEQACSRAILLSYYFHNKAC